LVLQWTILEFSQPVLPPALDEARIQDKLNALDLSLGIPNKKKFINHGRLDEKDRKTRKKEKENKYNKNQIKNSNQEAPFSTVMTKNLTNKNPSLDFKPRKKKKINLILFNKSKNIVKQGSKTSKIQ
jgi:hypothetical protein